MKDIIKLLPDSVANIIAAGEVIHRPYSVIKELVENSLDAGATKIQIVVADGGHTSIQVVDNGKGMSPTDARLAFEKHATSKIREAQDLNSLCTMGFRGEALASIAAVAEVDLKTRQADEPLGIMISFRRSKFDHQEECVCPVGANFTVRNLFWNIPARRSNMDSVTKDHKHNLIELEKVALSHPDVHFVFATPEATIKDLPPATFRKRIVDLFGKTIDKHLLHVEVETSLVKITGYVGDPESAKKKGTKRFFFANDRYMIHPYFESAVYSAFDRIIPDGEKVPFFLKLDVEPSRIDVNNDPQKTKIRFLDEQSIFPIIKSAVTEALGKFHATTTIDFNTEHKLEIDILDPNRTGIHEPLININPSFNPFEASVSPRISASNGQRGNHSGKERNVSAKAEDFSTHTIPYFSWADIQAEEDTDLLFAPPATEGRRNLIDADNIDLLQYKGRYIIALLEEGINVIDIPRAHTRILYEQMLSKNMNSRLDSQGLLAPIEIDLTPEQAFMLKSLKGVLEHLGFCIESTQDDSIALTAVPSIIEGLDPSRLLLNLIDDTIQSEQDAKKEVVHAVTLSLAKRAAIPSGQYLSKDEMRELIKRLQNTSAPNITPDGRVISTLIPHPAIVSKFH